MAIIVDSYSWENYDAVSQMASDKNIRAGQTFVGDGSTLDRVVFYLRKSGSPTGNAVATIYAKDSTYGKPTGSALATSGTVDVSGISTSQELVTFTFTGANKITLTELTNYVAVLEYSGGDSSNYILFAKDVSSPTHTGNFCEEWYDLGWYVRTTYDGVFYVYGDGKPLIDEYPTSYATESIQLYSGGNEGIGQSFDGLSANVDYCNFYIRKIGSPTGNIVAKLYAHTGTFGTNGTPTGSALATSDNVNIANLPTSYELRTFTFSSPYTTTAGNKYCIVLEYSGGSDANYLEVATDGMYGSLLHEGNFCILSESSWTGYNLGETIFYVYGSINANSERSLYTDGGSSGSSERLLYSKAGGITYSERTLYTPSGVGESDRGLYSYGKPTPVAIPFYQGKNDKKYSVKIYDRAGTTFKGNYDPIGGYAFTKTINGGVGALSITLPRKFDNFGLGEDVNLLDEIQIWVQDKDSSGEKIYSGYVSGITSYIDGNNQGVKLDVLGYVSRLGFTLDWDGTNVSMVRNSLTAGELVKDVIDKYRSTVAEERINYGTSTVDVTGGDISYTSNAKSCLETIERAREMAGATWYWYVDANNVFYFDEYATTPTHLFVFGKDVSSLEISRSADDIKNEFIFWNGLMADDTNFISNRYYNTASITAYWNRFEAATDGRVTTSAAADALGDSYINAYKSPNVSMRFEVKDNNLGAGYDIESIEPGHTCKILNLDDSDVVGDNMVITSVQYTPEKAIIYVSDLREMTGRSLTNLRRQLDSTVYGDRPVDITSSEVT
jgi:hypothetical protein